VSESDHHHDVGFVVQHLRGDGFPITANPVQNLQPVGFRSRLDRGLLEATPTTGRAVGLGDHQGQIETRLDQGIQCRHREIGRSHQYDSHANPFFKPTTRATSCGV